MDEGTEQGTTSLTLDTAADRLESLFSDEEETQPVRETPQPRRKPEPKSEPEEIEEGDEPEEIEEGEETDDVVEGDEPDGDEPEEVEEATTQAPAKVKVKVDGQDVEVTLEEVIAGYSRTADYTRKTQALAAEKKQFEQHAQAVVVERQQYAQALGQLHEVLQSLGPQQEPDWASLQATDPVEFASQWAAHQQHQQRMAKIAAERQIAEQRVLEDQRQHYVARLEAEQAKIFEKIPELADPTTGNAALQGIVSYAESIGISAAELDQLPDHRLFVLLDKARRFDEAQKKRPELQRRVAQARTPKPAAAQPPQRKRTTELTRQKQRLAKTGDVRDAARIFELLDD